MKLFFEGSTYDKAFLTDCFGDSFTNISRKNPQGSGYMLDVVGYFYNQKKKESYFILPKVFSINCAEGGCKAFGKITISSSSAIDTTVSSISHQLHEYGWQENIIYELPIWLYRAISKYRHKKGHKRIEQSESLQSLLSSNNETGDSTILDIVLALEDFYHQNKNLFIQIYKKANSGFNKINWSKTVKSGFSLVEGSDVVYAIVNNQHKEINYEEQLMCIFYNTLRYIANKFDPQLHVDSLYSLLPDNVFARQAERGIICKQLRGIKGNYYNDKLAKLWFLLYSFHRKLDDLHGGRLFNDYLLIKDFNIVFEDMVDELLSDTKVHPDLVDQKDGKILDHIFEYESLLSSGDEIYYVGDSKYYRDGEMPKGVSLYKQYTYVKNILQLHFDWYNQSSKKESDKEVYHSYRDDKTEGYNIIPNFFISADVLPSDTLKDSRLSPDKIINKKLENHIHNQYSNRLFDRDTLFLRQYKINFLFVLYSYVKNNYWQNNKFKKTAQEKFREDFLNFINKKYQFYVLSVSDGVDSEQIFNITFRKLIGKVYSPLESLMPMILALESSIDNSEVLSLVDEYYHRTPYVLGHDIITP